MKRKNIIKLFLVIVITVVVALLIDYYLSPAGGRKCCHNHGGIKECNGIATTKHLCNDGTYGNCPKHNH
jgi:hypothetical protein